MDLYKKVSDVPKTNAQRNLEGKSYFVSNVNLKFHEYKVTSTHIHADGLLFTIIGTQPGDKLTDRRVYTFDTFDVFGNHVAPESVGNSYRTRKDAVAAMEIAVAALDAIQITKAATTHEERRAVSRARQDRMELSIIVAAMKARK